MSEHRVSMLGSGLRRFENPETSRDPRIRELVSQLRTVDYAPAPRAHFRTELRSQLVAVAPRIIAEGTPAARTETAIAAQAPRRSFGSALRSIPIARPLGVAASVITVFALILGGAVWMSQKSLPGDALYGLKRASENVRLSLTSGDTARGHEYLSLATTRVQEAQDLAGRTSALGAGVSADSAISSHTAALIKSTLNSADSDLKSGSSLLGDQAFNSKSAKPLDIMTRWAPSQLTRLENLASALPAGSVKTHATSSWNLVNSAYNRAKVLAPNVDCGCLKDTTSDDLGPQPAVTTSVSPGPLPTSGNSASVTVRPGQSTGRPTTSKSTTTPRTTPKPKATSPGLSLPTITLPTLLPSKSASPPLSVDSCGVHISLIISLTAGTCSTGH